MQSLRLTDRMHIYQNGAQGTGAFTGFSVGAMLATLGTLEQPGTQPPQPASLTTAGPCMTLRITV